MLGTGSFSEYPWFQSNHCTGNFSDISRFFPRIDRIFPGEALNPFFGAEDEGISEFLSR